MPINPDNDTIEVWEDAARSWRWRRKDADNGNIVSESGEGYMSRAYAVEAAQTYNPGIEIVFKT